MNIIKTPPNEQNNVKPIGIKGACFLVIAIACLLAGLMIYKNEILFEKPTDIAELTHENGCVETGRYASLEAKFCFGYYGETTYKWNGIIPIGKQKHYVVYVDGYGFVSVAVKNEAIKTKLDILEAETMDYLDTQKLPTPVTFKGKTKHINHERNATYRDYIYSRGGNTFEVTDGELDTSDNKPGAWINVVGLSILETLSIVILVKAIKRRKYKSNRLKCKH